MKRNLTFILILILGLLSVFAGCSEDIPKEETAQTKVKLMSINIAGQDMTTAEYISTVKYPGQNGSDYSYAKRRKRLDTLISLTMPDVLMLQEVNGLSWWWPHLVSNEDSFFNTFKSYSLVGRTNRVGGTEGAGDYWYDLYNQLYYNKDKFEEVASGLFYLNSKRSVPFTEEWHEAIIFDSDDNNTCVWAVLKDKSTGISALYASTHLKTAPTLARAITNYRQTLNLTDGLYKLSIQHADQNSPLPIIVAGDFNMTTDQNYNYSYQYLTEKSHYDDAKVVAKTTDTAGTARVWGKNRGATKGDGSTSDGYRIDYFFSQGFEITKYKVCSGSFCEDSDGEVFYSDEPIFDGSGYDLSDHLPIYAEAKLYAKNTEILKPEEAYVNSKTQSDEIKSGTGPATFSPIKIVFTSDELIEFIGEEHFMRADIVEDSSLGSVMRLMATESSGNAFITFDYSKLMKTKGLTEVDLGSYNKIKLVYKTCLTVKNSELMTALVGEDGKVKYGKNTTILSTSENGYLTMTYQIAKDDAKKLSLIVFGTMGYANDISGTCGLYAGDAIYLYSLELIT